MSQHNTWRTTETHIMTVSPTLGEKLDHLNPFLGQIFILYNYLISDNKN